VPWWLILSMGVSAWRFWRGLGPVGRRALLRAGPAGLRSAQVRTIGAQALALGGAVAGLPALAGLGQQAIQPIVSGGGITTMPHLPAQMPGAPPVIVGQVVTEGPFPIAFVKMWQAGLATFAIDSEGRRWVFRNKLGIWKRVRATRNIVISGKDFQRARRIIRVTNRLVKMSKALKKAR